jgi:hypothetical protein
MHECSHVVKLLTIAVFFSSMSIILIGARLTRANGAAGTPFSGSVNPNPVVILAAGGTPGLQATFGLDIFGVDAGSTIGTFSDTASSGCTETLGGTAIVVTPTATPPSITADSNGRAHGTFLLSNCHPTAIAYETIGGSGSVNGTPVTNSSLANYTLEGSRP